MAEPWFFDVLPCRPAPEPDECLSGYVLRLAAANGIRDLWAFMGDLFPAWKKTNQIPLVRWEYPLDAWGQLPVRTQLGAEALDRLTVLAWVAKFRTPPALVHPLHNGPGKFLYGVIASHARVCPLCLQRAPYVRLLWRLSPIQVCLDHGCRLQAHCHVCQMPLHVIGTNHRHLRCGACQADWRSFPVAPATDELLADQARRQADVRFLLDPTVTLVDRPADDPTGARSISVAVGRKFRALRTTAGRSVAMLAHQLCVADGTLSDLELGRQAPLPLYLAYLEALECSWPEFAALSVSPEVEAAWSTPPHLALRQCPNGACPNHQLPPTTRVHILRDLPAQCRVRLRCTTCGRDFTRSYAGALVRRIRSVAEPPSDPARLLKSAQERHQVVRWGKEGRPNCWIARQLGWQPQTIRRYWRALRIEAEVHRAQAKRRVGDQQRRREALRARIDALLPTLLQEERILALRDVARSLGYNGEYLQSFPELINYVRGMLGPHNVHEQERRAAAAAARVQDLCAALPHSSAGVTLKGVLEQLDLNWKYFRDTYPELAVQVQQAVRAHQRQARAARVEHELAQIDAAAGQLVMLGQRVSHQALLAAAGVPRSRRDEPRIQQRLQQWVGGSARDH